MMMTAAKSPAATAAAVALAAVGPLLPRGGQSMIVRSIVECLWRENGRLEEEGEEGSPLIVHKVAERNTEGSPQNVVVEF